MIAATFSSDLDLSTVTYEHATLVDTKEGREVVVNVDYVESINAIVLTPLAPLAPGQTYTATLHPGIEGRYGHGLAGPVSWTFHTAPTLPEPIGPLPEPPTRPTTSAEDRTAEQTEAEEKAEKAKDAVRGFFEQIQKAVEEELGDGEDDGGPR
jgi:hypothetical protein